MIIEGWKYYNHAIVPTCAPHEEPNLEPIMNGSVWQLRFEGKTPLMVKYCTNYDCNSETSYWYIIKEGPFKLEDIGKYKKHVLKALERCEAKRINPAEYSEEMWKVTNAAFSHYANADNELTHAQFLEKITVVESSLEYWGAFNKENGQMAGWMSCDNHGTWTETVSAKYHPELQSWNRPSDVIHYAILNYYLNDLKQKYICSGSRNINHKTNVQDYKIDKWKFRRAYCNLHIVYNPKIKWLIKALYPFRCMFNMLDGITRIHQLNALLCLEQLARSNKTKRNE